MSQSTSVTLSEIYMRMAIEQVRAAGVHLRGLRAERQPETLTFSREGHLGTAAHPYDVEMDEALRSLVYAQDPTAVFTGEESDAGANLRARKIFVRCDAIDGTTNMLAIDTGYAIVVFYERVRSDGRGISHLAGAIYQGNGVIVAWCRHGATGTVHVLYPAAPTYDFEPQTTVIPGRKATTEAGLKPRRVTLRRGRDGAPSRRLRAGDSKKIAAVAASEERSGLVRLLYDFSDPDVTFYNFAGNPLAEPLLLGDLGAIIEVKSPQLHDCAYLMPLRIAGGQVLDHDGRPIDVFETFERIGTDRRMEPFVATASLEVAADILEMRRFSAAA
jgi:fructose-1,6-bisphosphatase/inositol monophosphatase family enzyme